MNTLRGNGFDHGPDAVTAPAAKSCGPTLNVVEATATETELGGDKTGPCSERQKFAFQSRMRPWTRHAILEPKDVAARIGKHPNSVLNWANGRARISYDDIFALVEVFDDKFLQDLFGAARNGDLVIGSRNELARIHHMIGQRLAP